MISMDIGISKPLLFFELNFLPVSDILIIEVFFFLFNRSSSYHIELTNYKLVSLGKKRFDIRVFYKEDTKIILDNHCINCL